MIPSLPYLLVGYRTLRTDENHTARLLEVCRRYEQPILIGSDAHSCPDVHNHERALALLEELDFPAELVVNTSLEAAAEFIPFLGKLLRGELTELNAIL